MRFSNDKREEAKDMVDIEFFDRESVQSMMARLQRQIFFENYYVKLYEHTLEFLEIRIIDIERELLSVAEIVELCNMFWELLPDVAVIHRKPFSFLCELVGFDELDN